MKIATGISIPKEFVIPVGNLSQTQKKQVEQNPRIVIPASDLGKSQKKQERNRRHVLQKGAVSKEGIRFEELSEEKDESVMFSFRDLAPEHLGGQIKEANKLAESLDRSLRFFVHKDSGRAAVKVVDNNTGKVIKTIPPEEFLNFVAKIKKVAGIFFDKGV